MRSGSTLSALAPWSSRSAPACGSRSEVLRSVAMPTVTFDLPDDVLSALRRSPEEFAHDMRLAAAIHWYSRGVISQERAAHIAGLDRAGFLAALARERVEVFAVDADELRRELDAE